MNHRIGRTSLNPNRIFSYFSQSGQNSGTLRLIPIIWTKDLDYVPDENSGPEIRTMFQTKNGHCTEPRSADLDHVTDAFGSNHQDKLKLIRTDMDQYGPIWTYESGMIRSGRPWYGGRVWCPRHCNLLEVRFVYLWA